jgi:hypothetical protein
LAAVISSAYGKLTMRFSCCKLIILFVFIGKIFLVVGSGIGTSSPEGGGIVFNTHQTIFAGWDSRIRLNLKRVCKGTLSFLVPLMEPDEALEGL